MHKAIHFVTVFSAVALITACIVQQDPPYGQPYPQSQPGQRPSAEGATQPRGEFAQAPGGLRNGDYSCSFKSGGYQYNPFVCVVYTDRSGRKVLEKLTGSQRIRGTVTAGPQGFDFSGTYFCPWGSCTQETAARFSAYDDGLYKGTLSHSTGAVEVTLQHQPGGFGGARYGGARYGGARYGGARYGGARYGGARYAPARRF